jgi:DNA-binding response OmpR family regulator
MSPDDEKKRLPRILLLEDQPRMAHMYELFLAEDFQVVVCEGVKKAAEVLTSEKHDFDLVLSDYRLSDGTCFDVLQTNRLLKGKGTPPWLIITADPIGVEFASQQEGVPVLSKPFQREELLERIFELLAETAEDRDYRNRIREQQRKHRRNNRPRLPKGENWI